MGSVLNTSLDEEGKSFMSAGKKEGSAIRSVYVRNAKHKARIRVEI
jgi:hypothetical protein